MPGRLSCHLSIVCKDTAVGVHCAVSTICQNVAALTANTGELDTDISCSWIAWEAPSCGLRLPCIEMVSYFRWPTLWEQSGTGKATLAWRLKASAGWLVSWDTSAGACR